jgi:hypothetical protein
MMVLGRREAADDVVVALLGVGQGEAGADLQGPAAGVAAIRLDERAHRLRRIWSLLRVTNAA